MRVCVCARACVCACVYITTLVLFLCDSVSEFYAPNFQTGSHAMEGILTRASKSFIKVYLIISKLLS